MKTIKATLIPDNGIGPEFVAATKRLLARAGVPIQFEGDHQLVKKPEQFEFIFTTSMNGDILSDLTSVRVGGLGFAPSANVGDGIAIFEAVHGKCTEIYRQERYQSKCGHSFWSDDTRYFGLEMEAMIARLDHKPHRFSVRPSRRMAMEDVKDRPRVIDLVQTKIRGVDVFIRFVGAPHELGRTLETLVTDSAVKHKMISSLGRVYPDETQADCANHWRCRFINRNGHNISDRMMGEKPGWTKAQGEE